MKTINTTLPLYDRLEKQCFQRGIHSCKKPVPVIIPYHRFPSLQYNVGTDDPGEINSIKFVEKDPQDMITGWTNGTGLNAYDVFIASGSSIISASSAFASRSESSKFSVKRGNLYIVTINLTLTAGGYVDFLANELYATNTPTAQSVLLYNGVNIIPCRAIADATDAYIMLNNTVGAIAFSATISIESESMDRYFGTPQTRITTFTNFGYDTYVPNQNWLTSVIKTTAADSDYITPTLVAAINATIGDVFRFVCVLRLNSGTAPKLLIVDSTGADASNVVTLKDGINYVLLKSTITDAASQLRIRNGVGEVTNFMLVNTRNFYKLSNQPIIYDNTPDDTLQYNGEPLQYLIPTGEYYLKLTTVNDFILYSDWLRATCVYENLITEWTNTGHESFSSVDTAITACINTAGTGLITSDEFQVIKGEKIRVLFNLNLTSGDLPVVYLVNSGWTLDDSETAVAGDNDIELIAEWTGAAKIIFYNATNTNYQTGDVSILRRYSEKYLTFIFSHSCDLGDIIYDDGLEQVLWLESESMEPVFPYTEKGQENGLGEFVPTWQRQDKTYLIRTLLIPQFIVDVLHRLKLHDTILLIDLVGDEWTVEQIDVEHEWQGEDKYYALATITVDLGEGIVTTGCCT